VGITSKDDLGRKAELSDITNNFNAYKISNNSHKRSKCTIGIYEINEVKERGEGLGENPLRRQCLIQYQH
jgi:hypothetical protein